MSAPGPVQRLENGKGGRNNWRTPDDLFRLLEREWGEFTIDGAADADNTKCARYYDEAANAFLQNPRGEQIFVNPPYGAGWKAWIALFERWAKNGNRVVALVPSATDTEWWAQAHRSANETALLSGRVSFIDPETGGTGSNTTGSTVFVWHGDGIGKRTWLWDWKAQL